MSFTQDWFGRKFEPILANKTLEVSAKMFPGSLQWDRGGGSLFVFSGHGNVKAAELQAHLGLPNLWTDC